MSSPPNRKLLAEWLRAIPQSRHEPCPLPDLPGADDVGLGMATMLQVWGAVELGPTGIRAISQPAFYFLHSLAAWAEGSGPVISDWSQDEAAARNQGLRHGTSLVYLMEMERLQRDALAPPIRYTPVAQILIVHPGSPPRFLGQWDDLAGAYQLIGGRQKRDLDWVEPIYQTALRELEEELHGQVRHEGSDLRLIPLAEFDGHTRISPSFGALTNYRFSYFLARELPAITLAPTDRWLSRHELLAGQTDIAEPVRGDHILLLERAMGHSIDDLPSSFKSTPPSQTPTHEVLQ